MSHKFFMDGDTLMVSMKCDPSTVVTRRATDDEQAENRAAKRAAKARAAKEKAEATKAAEKKDAV